MTTEDLIGAEVIDALDGSWLELRLPDGRVVEVRPEERIFRPNEFSTETMTVSSLVVEEMVRDA